MTRLESRNWDSAFFGYPVASVELAVRSAASDIGGVLEEARRRGIRLLYAFLPPGGEALRDAFRREGMRFVGQKVDFAKTIVPSGVDAAADPEIVPCRTFNAALERLAIQSGEYSRFRCDDGFRNREFERLYREWLAVSLEGRDGQCVFAVGEETRPRGMITLEPGAAVRIGLFAVDSACRRQGIGRRLMVRAEQYCVQQRAAELRVATQAENRQACLFYESQGFAIASAVDVFHAWLPDKPTENTQERKTRP